MRKELLKPVINAIFALLLISLVKIVAFFILIQVDSVYAYIDIALSLAVVIVLLKFMKEFNGQLAITSPQYPQVRQVVKWIIILMIILTLYGAFGMFSDIPFGLYYIIFFVLVLIPIYFLWEVFYKNSDMLPDILRNLFSEEIIECSCGWKNPKHAKFCSRCGLPLAKSE